MGGGEKKEYRLLGEKPVLLRSLEPFLRMGRFDRIVITIPRGDADRASRLLQDFIPADVRRYLEKIELAEGGSSRQESVRLGLERLESSLSGAAETCVLIHDAARPWISQVLIRRVMEDLVEHGACIPTIPAADAMKQVDPSGFISGHLHRNSTVRAQTPQGFVLEGILRAHRRAARDHKVYIDDSEIFHNYIGPVHTVDGDRENTKITFPEDFPGAEGP
ncbi:MAG TPA: 2-C-methyl-D-erythritol 4-phosphate cytidylyltransferase [Sediminispirochaeta sp.]|nr:2-C-methyl-D-erythritol 4-phosphate cytidylyltransferase [Sediminispirochaeta sp.]